MVNIGYIFAGIGLCILALSSAVVYNNFPGLNIIPKPFLLMLALGLIGAGLIVLLSSGEKKGKAKSKEKSIQEVPIYQEDKIVGYRRHY